MILTSHNDFSMETYEWIINDALCEGYRFVTLSEFIKLGCPDKYFFVIRHDLDHKPSSLEHVINSELKMGVRSTTFIRVAGAEYNPLSYPCFKLLKHASEHGMELGLHTNFVEFAAINKLNPRDVLESELNMLRAFFPIRGLAPHRDINYLHNSLPWLEEHWKEISEELKLDYHAYEDRILSKVVYANEGFNPHLCWRTHPSQGLATGRSIYMLTHPHWWFKNHPFETP